jgi:glycosyltransferase involved in cell wall biosynthesis
MNILALDPYHGGSHRAFLRGWSAHSRHTWTVLDLPPRKWKWRMRHAAVTFTEELRERCAGGESWDLLFCTDMLNVAEFRGLAPPPLRELPCVAYFHENQLTYPFRYTGERDFHFGFTNMTTALAADQVWFNTAFHREDFLSALHGVLKRMPDYQPLEAVGRIRGKSQVHPPGIPPMPRRPRRRAGPLRIVWAARWEHDKNPDDFFAALRLLRGQGVPFGLSVVGEQFKDAPPVFEAARREFADVIDRWGYQATRAEYEAALLDADVFVSTADHEFFGISAVEALAAGCYPLLPKRLAYPDLLGLDQDPIAATFFYDGTIPDLAAQLADAGQRLGTDTLWPIDPTWGMQRARRFTWPVRAAEMDGELASLRSGAAGCCPDGC